VAESALRELPETRNLPLERRNARRARIGMGEYIAPENNKTIGQAGADWLMGTALATAPVPGVGDVAGLAADAAMYAAYPEERNWLNYGLTALGTLPAIPAASAIRQARKTKEMLQAETELAKRGHSFAEVLGGRQRMDYPGIYKAPDQIVEEANRMVGPESGAMEDLFGVTRQDLYDTAINRKGNVDYNFPGASANPRGAASAQNIMTDENAERLVSALNANRGTPLEQGMTGWYVMDPAYKRLEEIHGPVEAKRLYDRFNIVTGIHSANADVISEMRRGTAANMMLDKGNPQAYIDYAGMPAKTRAAMPEVPPELQGVPGHMGHKTAHGVPFKKYALTGFYGSKSPKVPTYIQASRVPDIGFQTNLPVGDAHFSRAVGLADVRTNASPAASWTTPEGQTMSPWFQQQVASGAGYQPVSAQSNLWGLFGPQTGVKTQIGATKLELLADEIILTADRMGISPEEARDLVLSGKARVGPK
tara:strand:+ start:503 stop:1939 length:1437 start_codon:yes stop_codon:yes gene_type:complete